MTITDDVQAADLLRHRALTEEQINALDDTIWLAREQELCEHQEIAIRTCLEFPDDPGDLHWYRNARHALIMFRLAIRFIDRRIKVLRRERVEINKAAKYAERHGLDKADEL